MHINYQSNLFLSAPILPSIEVTIVIPVKDEETYIQDLLKSLKNQVDLAGKKINYNRYEILILANNCTDDTVDLIKKFKLENRKINLYLEEVVLETDQANIGFVRKALMDLAYTRLTTNGGGIMLTTDGDTIVANDWIYQNIAEIERGAEAVGGRILLKEEELADLDEATAFLHKNDEEYRLLIAELEATVLQNFDYGKGCHHQNFNGSFAVTTECYRKSGGIPPVKHLEDCAFYDRLNEIDANVRHSHHVVVWTSARCIGRTDIGLSQQLNVWKNIDIQKERFLVECSTSLLFRCTIKKQLKDLWNRRDIINNSIEEQVKRLAQPIEVNNHILESFRKSSYFGDWFQEIEKLNRPLWEERFQLTEIDEAIADLRFILKTYSS